MTNNTIIALSVLENRLMSKAQLVASIKETGDVPFHSFHEWKTRGFSVKKGEHGVFKAKLWVKTNYSEEELKKMKKGSNWFFLQNTALFSREQVELTKEERKFPLSEKTVQELAENGVSLKEKKAEKTIAKQTSKKSENKKAANSKTATAKAAKTETKATVKATEKKAETKLAKAESKNVTKKTEVGKMTADIDHGIEIIRIDLTKADGNYAWIEMPKAFYMNMKKTEKRKLEKMWGLA